MPTDSTSSIQPVQINSEPKPVKNPENGHADKNDSTVTKKSSEAPIKDSVLKNVPEKKEQQIKPSKESVQQVVTHQKQVKTIAQVKKQTEPVVVPFEKSFYAPKASNVLTNELDLVHFRAQYYPDWTDQVQLKQLSLKNPTEYTTYAELNKPEEYKLKITVGGTDWFFWTIIAGLSIFAWVRMFFAKSISNTLAACINAQVSNRLFRERNSLSAKIDIVLNILFALNGSLFAFQAAKHYSLIPEAIEDYYFVMIAFGLITCIYIGKEILLRILGFLTDISAPIQEYLHIVGIYNKSVGLLLFPIVVAIQYAGIDLIPRESIIYIGFYIIGLAYLVRIIRGLIISIRTNLSVFYAILYLCALEIAPNMLLYIIATTLF